MKSSTDESDGNRLAFSVAGPQSRTHGHVRKDTRQRPRARARPVLDDGIDGMKWGNQYRRGATKFPFDPTGPHSADVHRNEGGRDKHIEGRLFAAVRKNTDERNSCSLGTNEFASLIELGIVDFAVPQGLKAAEEVVPPHLVRLCADHASEKVIHRLSI